MHPIDSITQTVCDAMGWLPGDLRGDTLLQNYPDWDSVNQLRVMMALESATDTRIPMKRFLEAQTMDAIREVVLTSSPRGA